MWDDLRADIEVDIDGLLGALGATATDRAKLLEPAEGDVPRMWDLQAAGGVLHGCYTGMENILKQIASAVDKQVPDGVGWHAKLLLQISQPSLQRPAVISSDLFVKLRELMGFRHVVRVHYGHDLDWARRRPLVDRLPEDIDLFVSEIRAFIKSLPAGP